MSGYVYHQSLYNDMDKCHYSLLADFTVVYVR